MVMRSETQANGSHRKLIAMNGFCALSSVIAAVLIYAGEKNLGLPGLAGAPHHEPLIVHCLLIALLLSSGNAHLRRERREGMSALLIELASWFLLAALAIINLLLAGKAALNLNVPAAVVLAVPGILCGWTFFALQGNADENDSPAEGMKADETASTDADALDQEVLNAAEQSKSAPAATLIAYLSYGFAYVLAWGLIFLILALSISYYYLLHRAIFSQQFFGWPHFFSTLTVSIEAILPYFIGLSVVLFGLYAGMGMFSAVRQNRDWRRYRDINRELTNEEIDFIDRSFGDFVAYADNFSGKGLINVVNILLFTLLVAAVFGWLYFALGSDSGLGAEWFEAARTRGLEWYIYIDDLGAGDILALFSSIMLFGALASTIGIVWPRFGAHAILDYRKNRKKSDDPWSHYRRAIALDVRRGLLSPSTGFKPAEYVRDEHARIARIWIVISGAFVAVNLVFLYLDRMDYDLLTEEYMEYTDYWTSKLNRMEYGDVGFVEISCAMDKDDGLYLAYRLKFDDDRAIDAVDFDSPRGFRSRLPKRLDAWVRVDAKLRAAAVPVRHEVRTVKGRPRPQFVERECVAGLDGLLGKDVRARVMPLLRETGDAAASG